MTAILVAGIVLFSVGLLSGVLLVRDVSAGQLRQRVDDICTAPRNQSAGVPTQTRAIRSVEHGQFAERMMRFLRFNPDIPQQNSIPWQIVFAISALLAVLAFLYGRTFVGWQIGILIMPFEGLMIARYLFGWERARFQRAILEQIPDVMALICRAVSAGIPLSEAIRSVTREAPSPSREEFVRVVTEVAIGQSLETALWKLHERVEVAEYAFFAVTIGLQSQTGGSLVETLDGLQDVVRKRVILSKRGKALAAEARMSAMILGCLPFVASLALAFIRPGFFEFYLSTSGGHYLLLLALSLMSLGIVTMRQMIRRSLAP